MISDRWILIAVFCYFIVITVSIVRWQLLLNAVNIHPGIRSVTRLTFIGYAFNMIIPGGVGGDIVKAYYVARGRNDKRTAAVTTIGLDRLLGLFSMFLTGAISVSGLIIFYPDFIKSAEQKLFFNSIAILIICASVFMAAGLSIFLSRILHQTSVIQWLINRAPGHSLINTVYSTIYSFRQNKKVLLKTISLSFVSQFAFIIAMFCIGSAAMESNIRFQHYLFLSPVSLILNAIPISPGGIGSGEYLVDWLFKSFGSQNGSEIMFILHAIFILVSLAGFIVYIRGRHDFQDIKSKIQRK